MTRKPIDRRETAQLVVALKNALSAAIVKLYPMPSKEENDAYLDVAVRARVWLMEHARDLLDADDAKRSADPEGGV